MSADNWRQCPRCVKKARADNLVLQKKAAEAYGKVPAEEWQKMTAEANKPIELDETFREDYELGVCDDGEFYVSYSGYCKQCDFSHKFSKTEQLKV